MPNNVDDFRDSDTFNNFPSPGRKPHSNHFEPGKDPNNADATYESLKTAFLIGVDDEFGLRYRTLLENMGMKVFEFKNRDDALEFSKQTWPALVMLPSTQVGAWTKTILGIKNVWQLLPDHILLVDVKDYIAKEINGFDAKGEYFDILAWVLEREVSEAPFVIKTVLHPAEPQEIFFILETLAAGRNVREEHLQRQRLRTIYKQCADLASMKGRSPLLRAGLAAILDVTSGAGGMVFKHHSDRCGPEYFLGMERIKVEKTLEFLQDRIPADSTETKWITFPQGCAKSRKKEFSLQGVVMAIENESEGFLRILVFPGKTTVWPENKMADVDLVLAHIRLGLRQLNASEPVAATETRDVWTGLLEEDFFLKSAEKRLGAELKTGSRDSDESYHALIVVDLDGFAEFNRKEGHLTGGVVIRNIARRLLAIVGGLGSLGRTGPDEFTVAIHDATPKMVKDLGKEISERIKADPIPNGGKNHKKIHTVSVGYAISKKENNFRALLCKAREMLDEARREGGGRIVGASIGKKAKAAIHQTRC